MVSTNLRVLMAKGKLNIQQLSDESGVSRTTISNLVNGYSSGIQFETVRKLATVLGCKPRDLF